MPALPLQPRPCAGLQLPSQRSISPHWSACEQQCGARVQGSHHRAARRSGTRQWQWGPLRGAAAWTETHPDDSTHNCSKGTGPGPRSALHRAAGSWRGEGGTHFSRGSSSHPRAGHQPCKVLTVTVGDSPHHRPALNTHLLVQCPGSLHKASSPTPMLQERKQDQHGITWATVQAGGIMG